MHFCILLFVLTACLDSHSAESNKKRRESNGAVIVKRRFLSPIHFSFSLLQS